MTFEKQIARLNEHFFFAEFTFSKTKFRPDPGNELELADSIIWLDDTLIAFQLKERTAETSGSDGEARWFTKKVLDAGTRQMRDTLAYLSAHAEIILENHRGHQFPLAKAGLKTIHKVISYLPGTALPDELRRKKFHQSRSAGVIHLIPAPDYLGIVHYLLTPPELAEYLAFREELIAKWGARVDAVPEHALLGQYLAGDASVTPDAAFSQYVSALQHKVDEWDMSGVIKRFPDRITTGNKPTDYYPIVTEIAKLKRNELREFKTRFQLSMQKARANVFARPYRMASPRTGCGFVFIPLEKEFIQERRNGLMNLTLACKYDLKLDKCIGVSFAPDGDEWYAVEWAYMNFPWEHDQELEQWLSDDNPFRDVRTKDIGRYAISTGQ